MSIRWTAFIIATLLAMLTIFFLPRLGRDIPEIPGNSIHTETANIKECILCHIESGGSPLPQDHAAREKCLYCHKVDK